MKTPSKQKLPQLLLHKLLCRENQTNGPDTNALSDSSGSANRGPGRQAASSAETVGARLAGIGRWPSRPHLRARSALAKAEIDSADAQARMIMLEHPELAPGRQRDRQLMRTPAGVGNVRVPVGFHPSSNLIAGYKRWLSQADSPSEARGAIGQELEPACGPRLAVRGRASP